MPPTAAPPTVAAVLPRPTAFPATPPIAAPPTVPSVSFVVPHPATAANAKAKATTYLVIASSGSNTQNAYGNSHARSAVHSTLDEPEHGEPEVGYRFQSGRRVTRHAAPVGRIP